LNGDNKKDSLWVQYFQQCSEVSFVDSVEFEGALIIQTVNGHIIARWKGEDSAENPSVLKANPRYLE